MSLSCLGMTPLSIAVSLAAIAIVSFVVTWSKQGIPGPNPWVALLKLYTIFYVKFIEVEKKGIDTFGKVYGVMDVGTAMLIVSDPKILKEMLVRNFASFSDKRQVIGGHKIFEKFLTQLNGDEWRQTRAIISPTFTSGKMKSMFPMISDAVNIMMDKVRRGAGQEFDLKALFGCLTMDIIAKCAFAIDTNAGDDPNNQFVSNARQAFEFRIWRIFILILMPKWFTSWLQMAGTPSGPWDYLYSLGTGMVAERRKQLKQGIRARNVDFLQLMVEAGTSHAEQEDGERDEHEVTGVKGKTLSDREIVSNTILVLIAGYETTASLLSYATYSLACNPDVQERLYQEIVDAGQLDYDSVTKLTFLDAVINESLRMYPPVMRVDRQVSEKDGYDFDCHLGKVHMPYGSGVIVPIYAMHHNEEYFPDPETFDPERFMPENRDKLVPYAFAPFVMGPRNCVGMRFALLEAKLTLASLIRDYRFLKSANTDVPLDLSKSLILLNPKRVIVQIAKR